MRAMTVHAVGNVCWWVCERQWEKTDR